MGMEKVILSGLAKCTECLSRTRPPFIAPKLPEVINPNKLRLGPKFLENGIGDIVTIKGKLPRQTRVIKATGKVNSHGFIGSHTCYSGDKEIGHISYHIKQDDHLLQGLPADYYAYSDKYGKNYTKPIVEINTIDGQGCGAELLQTALRDALQYTDGRIYLSAETVSKRSPVGFYYNLGFRSAVHDNTKIAELVKAGQNIPENYDGWMYLPKENIAVLQNYARKDCNFLFQ